MTQQINSILFVRVSMFWVCSCLCTWISVSMHRRRSCSKMSNFRPLWMV